MACSIFRNKETGEVTKVLAPNGKESQLYNDLVELVEANPELAQNDPYVNKVLEEGLVKEASPKELALAMWSKVYTKPFKDWFGDSKVVDENGEPLLVYHGSKQEFTEFDETRGGLLTPIFRKGFFFTPNKQYAQEFGEFSYPVVLRGDKPIKTKALLNRKEAMDIFEDPRTNYDLIIGEEKPDAESKFENNIPVYVVPQDSPNQIKSVFNTGAFSSTTNNIYYQLENEGRESKEDIAAALVPVLDKYGIKLSDLQHYAEVTGKTINESVVALADPFRKVIAVAKGKMDSTTLPEELAHIVIENNVDGYEMERALKYVEGTNEYAKEADRYRDKYKADDPQADETIIETKVKKEILGKILGKHILKNIERDGDNALMRMLRRMWNNFLSLFKDRDTRELENQLDRLATDILDVDRATVTSDVTLRGSLYTENPNMEIVVEGQRVGAISLENRGSELRINYIELDAAHRNQGIGEKAYTELGEIANTNGLQLVSDEKKTSASHAVWRKLERKGKAQKKGNKYYYVPTGVYYALDESGKKLLDDLIISLNARIKRLSKRGVSGKKVREQRRALSRELEKGHAELGIVKFLRLLAEDSDEAISYIQQITKDPRLFDYFTSPNTSEARLKQLMKEVQGNKITAKKVSQLHEFITYYEPYLKDLEAYIGLESKLSEYKRKPILKAIRSELEKFRQIESFKNNVRAEAAENAVREAYAGELRLNINDENIDQQIIDRIGYDWKAELYEYTKDSPKLEYWFGSLRDASDQILRIIHAMLIRIKQRVHENTINFGKSMIEKAQELGLDYQSFNWAFERVVGKEAYIDHMIKVNKLEGKEAEKYKEEQMKKVPDDASYYTGYFVSPWLARKWDEAKAKFHTDLHEKYEYPEDFEDRLDLKDYFRDLKARSLSGETLTEHQKAELNKFESYNKEIAEWYFANTQPVDNLNEAIDRRKKLLSKKEFAEWKRANIGTSYSKDRKPFNYYKGELVRPSTGRTRINPYDGSRVKTNDYTNKDWNKLSDNQKEFIKWMLQKKAEMDKDLPTSRTHATKAPQITESFIDIMHNQKGDMLRRIGINIKEGLEIQDEDYLQGEEPERRPDGSIVRYVPIRFTSMKDTNLISTDLMSSMIAYYEMTENYKEMTAKLPEFEVIQQQIGARTLLTRKGAKEGVVTNTYQTLNSFLDMNVSEMRKADLEWGGINWTAALNKVAQYVRANNLAWNLATQFTNMVSSTGFSWIEDIVGEHTTVKSKAWAHKEFWKRENFPSLMQDVMNPVPNNKMYMLMQHIGIAEDLRATFDNLDKAKATRMMTDAGSYKGYQVGDFVVKSKVMLAAMHNYRQYKGKFYTKRNFDKLNLDVDYYSLPSAYDKVSVKDGRLHIDLSENEKLKLFSRIEYISNVVDGRLSPADYAAIHQHAVFSLIAIHRNWLFSGIQRRYRKRGFNFMTGEMEEGHFNVVGRKGLSVFRMIKQMFANEATMEDLRVKLANGWQNMDDIEKIALKRVITEFSFAVVAAGIAVILNKLADDEDDVYALDLAAYLANRTAVEAGAFYNPQEFITVIKDPFVPLRVMEYGLNFMDILDGEDIERGPWEGWSKRERFFARLFPGVKGIQTMYDPSAPNQFLKSKPLKQLYNLSEQIVE